MTTTSVTDTPTTVNATADKEPRPIHRVVHGDRVHWVGDGFRVANVIPGASADVERLVNPFLLLDYHAPYEYPPTDRPRGVGVHPHRGFETVTLAFDGSVAHHDSTGAGGVINPGDVQWMTAASGILHQEYHEAEWAKTGGRFHMAQLWVNLPAADKMEPPSYQALTSEAIGVVELPDGAGSVRVVAGDFAGHQGPAVTHTPINLWDVQLGTGTVTLPIPDHHHAGILVLDRETAVNGTAVSAGDLVAFDEGGGSVTASTEGTTRLLVMTGEPIDEPVVAHGPFVMNTEEEILQAYRDVQAGRFGTIG